MNKTSLLSRVLFFLVAALSHSQGVFSEIYPLHSMGELEKYITEGAWVVFDLDLTVFESSTSLGHANSFYEAIEEGKKKGVDRQSAIENCYTWWAPTQKMCEMVPCESLIPSLIQKLQESGTVVMGCTSRYPVVAYPTLDLLMRIGIDFEKSAPSQKQIFFPYPYNPEYVEGVLFVGDYNQKGELLSSFIQKLNLRPKKVIFIDDGEKYLKSVEEHLALLNIPIVGLHYQHHLHTKTLYKPEIDRLQRELCRKILTDEQAQYLGNHL